MNSQELEELKSSIKRNVIFKYKPVFSDSFTTNIKQSQIVPFVIEVCNILQWQVIFHDENIVEVKRRRSSYGKDTEKITIRKSNHAKIYVKSSSLEQKFTDFGSNSMQVGIFSALFKKLEKEYQSNNKLEELEIAYNKSVNWEDYIVPDVLPKPKKLPTPSIKIPLVMGSILAISLGILSGFLAAILGQNNDRFYIFILIVLVALFGYVFTQILKYTNYTNHKEVNYLVYSSLTLLLIVNLLIEYNTIHTRELIDLNFFEFIIDRINGKLLINNISQGVSFVIGIGFFLFISYIITNTIVITGVLKYVINRAPEEVTEYIIYLFEKGKTEQEVRIKLSEKGWAKKVDQDYAFEAIGEIAGLQELRRE